MLYAEAELAVFRSVGRSGALHGQVRHEVGGEESLDDLRGVLLAHVEDFSLRGIERRACGGEEPFHRPRITGGDLAALAGGETKKRGVFAR